MANIGSGMATIGPDMAKTKSIMPSEKKKSIRQEAIDEEEIKVG